MCPFKFTLDFKKVISLPDTGISRKTDQVSKVVIYSSGGKRAGGKELDTCQLKGDTIELLNEFFPWRTVKDTGL